MRKISFERCVSELFYAYLRLVTVTAKIEIKNIELIKENTMIGYWHGDSYSMMLILKQLVKRFEHTGNHSTHDEMYFPINVIVTADRRGDYIENVLKTIGAKAIRLPNGLRVRRFLKDLGDMCATNSDILAASLDGPLGPLHEPKKLLFRLAHHAEKDMCYVYMQYSRVIRLKHRWDRYCIPLPFTRITAYVEHIGPITEDSLRDFEDLKSRLKVG